MSGPATSTSHAEDFVPGSDDQIDQQYFNSYGEDLSVHRLMLSDQPRMDFYSSAIQAAGVSGAIVIDCGAGTGVLSMLALSCGAAHVFSIEAAERIAQTILPTVRRNALRLTALRSGVRRRERELKKEDVSRDGNNDDGGNDDGRQGALSEAEAEKDILSRLHLHVGTAESFPVEQVFAALATCTNQTIFIVSEWMGFYLLHEGMLNSVVALRDRLKAYRDQATGRKQSKTAAAAAAAAGAAAAINIKMLPSHAEIFAAPFDRNRHIEHDVRPKWSFLGLDFSAVGAIDATERFTCARNPVIEVVHHRSLLLPPVSCIVFDLNTVTQEELDEVNFVAEFSFPECSDENLLKHAALHGFVLWFDVWHEQRGCSLRTGPMDLPTHWKQTVVMLTDDGVSGLEFGGDTMRVNFALVRDQRSYEIALEIE